MRRIDPMDLALWAILALGVLLVGLVVADLATGTRETVTATVVEKAYRPSSTSTSLVYMPDGNGSGHLQPVVTVTPEAYRLVVRIGSEVLSRSVTARAYADAEVGATVPITFRRGGITGARY